MRRIILWLFHALLITVPFAFTAVNEELFEFNKMILVYAFAVFIAGAWISRMILERRVIFRQTPLFWPIIIFLASQILSTITSIHPATSIFGYYSRFHGGLLSTLAYISLYFAATSNFDRKDVFPLIRTTIFAGIGAALYALPEHFGVSPSCVLISNEFSVACWVQDVRTRVFGTFGQPNWLAAYLLVLIPLSLWSWMQAKNSAQEKVFMAAFPLFYVVLLFTGSRSGFLGFFAGIAVFLTLLLGPTILSWFRSHRQPSLTISRPQTVMALFTVGTVIVLSLLFGTPYSPPLTEITTRLKPAQSAPTPVEPTPAPAGTVLDTGGTNSGEIRRIVWSGALGVWKRYPLFGSGVETFAYSYYQDRPVEHNLVSEWDFLYNKAHNEFLNVLATTGIFGLGALLFLMGSFVWHLARRRDPLALTLIASFTGLAVSNFFGFSTVMVGVLFFLMMAWFFIPEGRTLQIKDTLRVRPSRKKGVEKEIDIEFDARHAMVGATWIVAAILALSVWQMWQNDALLARAKRQVLLQQPTTAYQLFHTLTVKAPNEALYWDEKSVFLANLTAAAQTDATLSAQLASEAAAASDRAIELNPVHVTFWKSRAKVFLYLSVIDARARETALQALDQTVRLAPTDPKNLLNRALLLKDMGRLEEADADLRRAIELKPNYDLAKTEWEKLKQLQASSSGETL